ncbi:NAD(P)H-binding protein [Flagellimonas sp. DF-77]|uniref:NAD(P)H-binding protein n=1 Tax=Flagellimonas algarum TaxID=3230298 RepID=UPI003396D4B7
MKRILIAGASGMIGEGILQQALEDDTVSAVVSLVRRPSPHQHSKLQEIAVADFNEYGAHQKAFQDLDAAFFCIGVYTGQVPNDAFKEITVDYAVAFAKALANHSPKAKLCLLSGAGADRTERSRTAFAKFKGMAENQISALGLDFYAFRPAYIYPVTPRKEPNLMYRISRTLYPLIKAFGPNVSIPSTDLAQAMFKVGLQGGPQEILENRDIRSLVTPAEGS